METYSILREIADSWVLLAMFGFFAAVVLWAFRPGSTETYKSVSEIPLRNDTIKPCANCKNGDGCKSLKEVENV